MHYKGMFLFSLCKLVKKKKTKKTDLRNNNTKGGKRKRERPHLVWKEESECMRDSAS